MATAPLTPAQAELISSLSQDEIPIKLRCAICNKLAVNAFRLPCCEQAICETCQSTLPSSCPVCEHTPVAGEDCKPNKSLRTTIKVFLRTEEKKREALRLKDLKNTPPDTPATPAASIDGPAALTASLESASALIPDVKVEASQSALLDLSAKRDQDQQVSVPEPIAPEALTEAQQDIPQPSIEEIAPGQEQTEEGNTNSNGSGEVAVAQPDQNESTRKDGNGQPVGMTGTAQPLGFGMGYGFDGTTAASFPNVGLMGQGADFNQMQMMMAMQNGMTPNAFGTFPMMGMPGMTMDPMAMQNMYMNGGFGAQGMGMNGMNMGIGMAGYDGGVGTGFNNGWNGQQSWNIGQDNFNHPNAASMGHGDYGASNTGFQSTGFNQGNYGRSNQYNDYQQNGYGHQNQGNFFRGRGRGRGYGYGSNRGNHGYGQNESFSQNHFQAGTTQASAGSMSDRDSIPSGPKADMANAPPASNVDEFGRQIRQTSEAKVSDEAVQSGEANTTTLEAEQNAQDKSIQQGEDVPDMSQEHEDDAPKPIQTLEQIESNSSLTSQIPLLNGISSSSAPLASSGPSGRGQNTARGGYYGVQNDRSGSRSMQPPNMPVVPKVVDIPINAPTGPKAMREGLPNTSLINLRGRGGFPIAGRGVMRPNVLQTETTTSSVRSRSASPQREKETGRERDRDLSRSPSEDRDRERDRRSEKHRRRRHRSTSESEEEKDEERRSDRHRRRHRHRSTSVSEDEESRRERRRRRKYDEELDDADRNPKHAGEDMKVNDDPIKQSRSQSPADSRRSSHRSRRDRDRDRERDERDQNRDVEHKSSTHKHRSSHRSHRDRSRSRERDRDRDRDRDRERRHRHRHDSLSPRDKEVESRRPSTTIEPEKQEIKIPSGPRAMSIASSKTHPNGTNGIEIKGASTRRRSTHESAPIEDRIKSSSSSSHKAHPTPAATAFEDHKSKEREREREHDRDRDIERSSRDGIHQRRPSRDQHTTTRRNNDDDPPPPPPRSATSTKFPADTHTTSSSTAATTTATVIDPHTLEREARNRERLLKEAQRIAGLAAASSGGGGAASRKRSRDEISGMSAGGVGGGGGGGVVGDGARNGSRKYRRGTNTTMAAAAAAGGGMEGDEERIARLESEREGGRWG